MNNGLLKKIKKIKVSDELLQAFKEIQQPRTNYQLEKFVVGKYETPEQQYFHCVLELQLKYNSLRKAKIHLEKTNYLIEKYKKEEAEGNKLSEFKRREREIDKETAELAVLGALREFETLYKIWKSFDKNYTREEMDKAQPLYWQRRLTGQANRDVMACGRISVGNQDALRQIGEVGTLEIEQQAENDERV